MTPDQMRLAIEEVYAAAVHREGGTYPAEPPCGACSGVTPQAWFVNLAQEALALNADEFREKYALPAGESLASVGQGLGLTQFAALRIQDRPAAEVKGHTKTHKRERAFIVHATGWKGDAK